jgi:hypothetical protein
MEASIAINHDISNKKINNITEIKKRYLDLKNKISKILPKGIIEVIENRQIQCDKEIQFHLDRSYNVSLQLFKLNWWGSFSKLNTNDYPELSSMILYQNGGLLRSFDDFPGTVVTMDFHGYTQFSKDIKYNKTPLIEFGNILPQKIEQICMKCKSIVYEMEGDALIIIGPENPVYVVTAILCIIELCRQKPFYPKSDPKLFHGIDIKNPMIKPFEINAAVSTGGRVFINKNGHIIGSLISETSRILKIINTKKPNKSGIIFSEKAYRKLEKFRTTQTGCHVSIFDFTVSDPFHVDVKGIRLNIREVYLEKKNYIDDTKEYTTKLAEEIKKNNPGKWHNILSYYLNLVLAGIDDIKSNIQIGSELYSPERIHKILKTKFYEWLSNPAPNIINEILKITSLLYNTSEEIRDITAVYHEFIQENYTFIAKRLEDFYLASLRKEASVSPSTRKNLEKYEQELNNLKVKFPAKRIMENILSSKKVENQLMDVPYMGKK